MKTSINCAESITRHQNQSGLKLKPQIFSGMGLNHNPGGLRLKPQIVNGRGINHNQSGLRLKPQMISGRETCNKGAQC